ncbi:hypothetical protein [Burkholderia sp. PAMC 28687]|uniref:hypothetical protein n=1 Tax=Burkholderia sp. PAMC 28687 TaxID=1795874 RepID=UPI0012D72B8D|nr:hypothetical protein [Burkholderia sp. PAMC 28687]
MRAKLMIVATLRTSVCDEAGYAARILAQKLSLYRLAREIKLQPLSYNDVKAFLGRFAQADPPAMLTTHLHDHSEGNPLFMRAILDLLLQRDLVSWDQSGWRLDAGFESLRHCAPPNLLEIIEAEISALPLQTQCV